MSKMKLLFSLIIGVVLCSSMGCTKEISQSVSDKTASPAQSPVAATAPTAKPSTVPPPTPTPTLYELAFRDVQKRVYYYWDYNEATGDYQFRLKKDKGYPAKTKDFKTEFARLRYNSKTKCLTIRGKGSLYSDYYYAEYTDGMIEGHRDYLYYITEYPFDKNKVEKIIVKPGITEINISAFFEFKNVKEITLPNTVKKIEKYAFAGCKNLTEINIPDSVESIGKECFWACRSLRKITLGKNLSKIGRRPFFRCASLNVLRVDRENPVFSVRDGILYNEEQKIVRYGSNALKNATIRDGTKKIGSFAFAHHKNLVSVNIPASVEVLGGGAFYSCRKLRQVDFAANSQCRKFKICDGFDLRTFREDLRPYPIFGYCTSLREFRIPNRIEYLNSAFYLKNGLKKLYIGKSLRGNFRGEKRLLYTPAYYTVSKENPWYSSRNGTLYNKAGTKQLGGPAAKKKKKNN